MTASTMMEAWLKLMADAMRGSSEAQDALKMLTGTSTTQDHLMRWMGQFMPTAMAGMGGPQTEMFGQWLEQWWKAMGVVPRYRYLEQLERNEDLRRKLEECEKRTHSMAGVPGSEHMEETQQKMMNLWGSMLDETLKVQSQMMSNMMPRLAAQQEGADEESAGGKEKKPKGKEKDKKEDD